jgi:hypothetical protein
MKYLMFTFLIVCSIACKKINQTSGPLNVPVDGKSYLTVPIKDGSFSFRYKLLNLALREILQDQSELTEIEKINSGEELGELKLSKKEMEDYKRIRSSRAEIVVSFSDHVDIYFAPDGLAKEEAIEKLAILSENNSRLFWAQNSDSKLEKGRVYYVVNSTISEIQANDFRFHNSTENVDEIKNNLTMNFSRFQKVKFLLNVNLFQKDLETVKITGPKKHCTTELNESQLCEPCSFKMLRPTGKEISRVDNNLESIMLKINENIISLKDLGAVQLKNNLWELKLDFEKILSSTQDHRVKLEWLLKSESPNIIQLRGYDYSENCQIRDHAEVIDLTPRRIVGVNIYVAGRDLEIESIKE